MKNGANGITGHVTAADVYHSVGHLNLAMRNQLLYSVAIAQYTNRRLGCIIFDS